MHREVQPGAYGLLRRRNLILKDNFRGPIMHREVQPGAYGLLRRRGHATPIDRNTWSIMQMHRRMLLKINCFAHDEPP